MLGCFQETIMTSIHTTIKFDGPALDGKAMDVTHLAPALLALSELVKETNQYANGDRAGIRVLVNADLEQKCFELNIELALTIWEQAKLLIADERIQSAKEIAEWIGIIGGIGGSGYGLFGLIKWLKGRKIESVTSLKIADGKTVFEIRVVGENDPIQLTQSVYELYADHQTRQKAVAVLAPLRQEGYESLEFYKDGKTFMEFLKDDLPEQDGSDLPEVTHQSTHTTTTRAEIKIRKPAYEGQSRWSVTYKRAIEAAFDDLEWLDKFQSGLVSAPPGSSLEVELEEQYATNKDGEIIGDSTYRIKKVYDVKLPMKQQNLKIDDR